MNENKIAKQESFTPKVSIVIPVYNGSNYLAEAIDSALGQTYGNIEVIVVNDGSNDEGKTREIALSYGDKIRYFEKKNGGVATALNLGIEAMAGEYLSWLSHDDLYYPQKVATQVEWLRKHENKETILVSNFTIKNYITGTVTQGEALPEGEFSLPFALSIMFASKVHGCSMLFPKSCFSNAGLFLEELRTTQDYNFYFRLLKAGYTFCYLSEPLILTRHHKDQGTQTLYGIHVKEVNELYLWAFDHFFDQFQLFSVQVLDEFLNVMKGRGLSQAYARIRGYRDFRSSLDGLEAGKPAIWLYWENKRGQETPELIKLCWESIRRRNEGDFTVVLTNPDNIRYYLPDLNPSVWSFEQLAHRADYIRFNLLYEYGGIWLDSDFIAFRSLSPVLEKIEQHGFVYTGYKQDDGKFFPIIHFLGSKKHHPIPRLLVENADVVLQTKVALGEQPAWDEIGGWPLREIVNDDNSYRYETGYFTPLPVHSNGQKKIFYPIRLSRRFRKTSFGQMLPFSVYAQFLDVMGREILSMRCFLADALRKNISRKTLYSHRVRRYGLDVLLHDALAKLRIILSPQAYDRLKGTALAAATIARMMLADPGKFVSRLVSRLFQGFRRQPGSSRTR